MDKKEIVKEYSNEEISVIWKPGLCIHAGECVKRLPGVYKPNEKPWINLEGADFEELKSQIGACPSGALSYKVKNQQNPVEEPVEIKVNVVENGPLLISGKLEIQKPDGSLELSDKNTAFCRCGASSNKPFCDGEHRKINFKG